MDEDDFQGRLMPGERIVWSGQPATGLMLTGQDAFLIPFSLMWGGFAIFWEWSVAHLPTPGFFALWGIPFVAAGLYLIIGRFFADSFIRSRLRYAITNQRILILRKDPFGTFTSLAIDRLPALSFSERSNGRGTILFQDASLVSFGRRFSGWTPSLTGGQFLMIDDVRNVFDRIQKQASRPGTNFS